MWTNGVTKALLEVMKGKDKKAVDAFYEFSLKQINKMVELVRGKLT